MNTTDDRTSLSSGPGNVTGAERWLSLAGGIGLILAGARRGSPLSRMAMITTGASLLTRGATGYCAMKSALTGQSSMKDGFQEQWQRAKSNLSQVNLRSMTGSAPAKIDGMHSLMLAEIEEMRSAEEQFQQLLQSLGSQVDYAELKQRFSDYARDIEGRAQQLQGLVSELGGTGRGHADQAMQSLIKEAQKMARIADPSVRDAALVASIQRIIHYKIAGYGSIAAYAKSMGHNEHAGRFAEQADRDKAIDEELTELAKSTLNPQASTMAEQGNIGTTGYTGELRH